MASAADERDQQSQAYTTTLNLCNEIIPTLPQTEDWVAENLLQYKGFWLHSDLAFKSLFFIENHHFIPKPDDIFLSSYPKCGTTWLKALLFATFNRSSYDISTHPLLTSNPQKLVPFLENLMYQDPSVVNDLPSPRLLQTHIAFTLIPEYIISNSKFVFICRDPKDALVSFWHFAQKLRSKELPPLSFADAFDKFCDGVSPYGPYWDHVLSYWKASLKAPEKILFLKYEDIKRKTVLNVKRLAEFIGKPFSIEEENEGIVDEIIRLCSFEKLSDLDVNKVGKFRLMTSWHENSHFFRKGEIGDWKNYLTPGMAARMDQITKEKFHCLGLTFS